jgi:hypothetical protein
MKQTTYSPSLLRHLLLASAPPQADQVAILTYHPPQDVHCLPLRYPDGHRSLLALAIITLVTIRLPLIKSLL